MINPTKIVIKQKSKCVSHQSFHQNVSPSDDGGLKYNKGCFFSIWHNILQHHQQVGSLVYWQSSFAFRCEASSGPTQWWHFNSVCCDWKK